MKTITTNVEERFQAFKTALTTISEYPITSALENMDAYNLKVIAEYTLKKDKEFEDEQI